VWDPSVKMGVAGDWLSTPSIEGAWRSGQALAAHLAVAADQEKGVSGGVFQAAGGSAGIGEVGETPTTGSKFRALPPNSGGGGGGGGGGRGGGGGQKQGQARGGGASDASPSKTLYVRGFDGESTTRESLKSTFEKFGAVSVNLQKAKGFAFVEMASPDQAASAIEALGGQTLVVELRRGGGGGGGGGGGRGGRGGGRGGRGGRGGGRGGGGVGARA